MFFAMRRLTLCDSKNTCTRAKWITERLQTHVLQLTSEAIGRSAGIADALKHFFDFCLEQQVVAGNPVKPSHFVRRGRPLPKALSLEQVQRLAGRIDPP